MIFFLDFILILNLLLAYLFFKTIFSPPFLMGLGMLAASIVATLNYSVWEMDKLLLESVTVLGFGTLWFTIVCILLSYLLPSPRFMPKGLGYRAYLNISSLKLFYIFSDITGIIGTLALFYYMRQSLGPSMLFLDVIGDYRNQVLSGDVSLNVPRWVQILNNYSSALLPISIFLLSVIIQFCKHNSFLKLLLAVQVLENILKGWLSGAKGNILPIIMAFIIVYSILYFAKKRNFNLDKKFTIRFFLPFILLFFFFKSFDVLIGRQIDMQNSDHFAIYCGAEIKNFDIYMHGNGYDLPSMYPGDRAFRGFYSSLYPQKYDGANIRETFNFVGNYSLGNVNTQFYYFHVDYGFWGVIFMQVLLAIISMIFYSYGLKSLRYPFKLNIYMLLYATYSIQIFLAFFSNRFISQVINLSFLRKLFWLALFIYFFNNFFVGGKKDRNGMLEIQM